MVFTMVNILLFLCQMITIVKSQRIIYFRSFIQYINDKEIVKKKPIVNRS